MKGRAQFKITSSLTPNDVSILLLVYLYSCHKISIPTNIFVMLIASTIPSAEINPILEIEKQDFTIEKPLAPFLESLVSHLLDVDERQLALQLVAILKSLESIDDITQLLSLLEVDCLVENYRIKRPAKLNAYRLITKTSYIGEYLDKCLLKYHLGSFDDREELWESLTQYMLDFMESALYKQIEDDLKPFSSEFVSDLNKDSGDKEMISLFKQFGGRLVSSEGPGLLIGDCYLQCLLNWEILNVCKNKSRIGPTTRQILASLSLNDLTHFPAVHVLNYLEAVFENSYQDAADALHNYFDYMLTQNEENCFHISLLCLATFHTCMHDCPAAIKSFEEATKVARESKNTATLNLIMIWVVNFIEIYPEYSSQFHVTVEQIVRYLKFCPDNENSLIFEKAYKFESLLLMMDNADATLVLESSFKYTAVAIQRLQFGADFTPVCKYGVKLWEALGQPALSEVYRRYLRIRIPPAECDNEIERGTMALESKNFPLLKKILQRLSSPRLSDEHSKQFKLLEIKYLTSIKDFEGAMQKVSENIRDLDANITNAEWKFKFQVENCYILLSCGMPARCLPILKGMLDAAMQSKNPLRASQSMVLLAAVLTQLGKYEESSQLLESNLHVILQYPQLESEALQLFKQLY